MRFYCDYATIDFSCLWQRRWWWRSGPTLIQVRADQVQADQVQADQVGGSGSGGSGSGGSGSGGSGTQANAGYYTATSGADNIYMMLHFWWFRNFGDDGNVIISDFDLLMTLLLLG